MKFGLALPYNQTTNITRWAQEAETRGWDGVFLGDAVWTEDPMVKLAAAATATTSIRLGIMIAPAPLRKPWKLSSEAAALDQLSNGRMILGLGTGAAWMGWHAFPDVVTDIKTRIELLEETIEILSLLDKRMPFDFQGKHYILKLSQLDEINYPPEPVQQPRIPLWTPAVWPREKAMHRAVKCDGVIVEVRTSEGKAAEVTPEDVRRVKDFVTQNRTLDTPFDIVVDGNTGKMDPKQRTEKLSRLEEAGVTWWIEGMWGDAPETVTERIQQGPL
jgi:alkanesulfonate monooxygenase SsuD/methylene tetrahydromethanopterin reductase-like flavin-dependent oxidoreductase (luciferase family)